MTHLRPIRTVAILALAVAGALAFTSCSAANSPFDRPTPASKAFDAVTKRVGSPYGYAYSDIAIDGNPQRNLIYNSTAAFTNAEDAVEAIGFVCTPNSVHPSGSNEELDCTHIHSASVVQIFRIPPGTDWKGYATGAKRGPRPLPPSALTRGGIDVQITYSPMSE